MAGRRRRRVAWPLGRAGAALLVAALAPASVSADPGYYVVTAYDVAGQTFADLRYWTVRPRGGRETVWPELGIGHGVNGRWTTELLFSGIGPSNLRTRLSTINWINEVLLTQGQWPVDVALHAQLVRGADDGLTAIELGPVLQTDIGRTQLNANVFVERARRSGRTGPTQLKLQWQVRHRWMRGLHLGAQGHGELGPWNDWAPGRLQSHRAGPAAFGALPLDGGGTLSWQVAWLIGKTYARRGHMASARLVLAY